MIRKHCICLRLAGCGPEWPLFRRYHRAVIVTVVDVLLDVLQLLRTTLHSQQRVAAENLFLRKQLALYTERPSEAPPGHQRYAATLVILTRFIDWRPLLTIVQPDTLVRWHRHAFRLFWRWKSRCTC
jgi:putative transposase